MLPNGTQLGPYEIVAPLGTGGMGEVYKARDTRLDRTVAVKILPAALAADPQFRERFHREARAISQLAHPHICTLHDVGQHDGSAFLVMELIEGDSLAARLEKGPLPVDLALKTGIEIASALDAAHRAGIVHRDLKPGNIMLTRAGAKLLDFGLAKSAAPAVSASGLSMLPTTPPATITASGTILGTFQYMAPEQIEGMEADVRTDIFAFGCVLYEMFTGRKAFEGKTRASLLGAILKDEPTPISHVQTSASPALDRIIATCLAKEPDDRWQTARDLLRELKWVADGTLAPAGTVVLHEKRSLKRHIVWSGAAAVAALLGGGAGAWFLLRPQQIQPPIVRLQATPPDSVPLYVSDPASDVAVSPDGTHLAFIAGQSQLQAQLYVRSFDQDEATPLAGTNAARGPFFSPDGEWIGYFQGGDLKKVPARGGPPATLCAECANGSRGATWGDGDNIVFSATAGSQGLRRIPAGGAESTVLTTVDAQKGEQAHVWPEFLPGGRAILFTVSTGGSFENALIVARDLETGAQQVVVRGGSQPRYVAATSHLVYGVAGTLRAAPFDLKHLSVVGSPVSVLEHVLTKGLGAADFSMSRAGLLAYISGGAQTLGQQLVWVDRQGHEEAIPAPVRNYVLARLSPDGQRVALDVRDQQNDIWIWDFARSVLTRLTTHPTADYYPVWTPDGRRIAFSGQRFGAFNVFWQPADGTGTVERLTTSSQIQYPWAFTPDGKSLILRDTDPKTGPDVSVMSLEGDRAVKPLIHTPFVESNAELSPDGRWIAYQSNDSGRDEVHVRPFPAVESGHWQISSGGGMRPLWAHNGRELFYIDSQNRIMTVPILAGESFAVGTASAVVERVASPGGTFGRHYDVSPDGRRFLLIRPVTSETTTPQLNVVINWGEELKRLAPVKR